MYTQIILESHDLAGKSTQFKEIWNVLQKKKNYNLLLNDRGLFSILCYGVYYKRFDISYLRNLEKEFINYLNNNLIFYLKINKDILIERFNKRGDELRNIKEIIDIKDIYDKYANNFFKHPNFHIIDIEYNKKEITKKILNIINKFEKRTINDKINCAKIIINNFGEKIYNTKEIINYNIKHDIKFKADGIHMPYKDVAAVVGKYAVLEENSYNYQFAKFEKDIEKHISGYYGEQQHNTSRKFVFTDDECLSFFHILVRNNKFIVCAHFRSSNIDLFEYDYLSILKMINIFAKKTNLKLDTELNIYFDSLHRYIL